MGRRRGQLWIQNGTRKLRRSPCAQLTEKETEAGIRSAKAPNKPLALLVCPNSHNHPGSLVCPPESPRSLGPGCSPALPHPCSSYRGRCHISLGIYSLAGTWPPGKSAGHISGGIRSQELSGQNLLRLQCPARLRAEMVEMGKGPCPTRGAGPSLARAGGQDLGLRVHSLKRLRQGPSLSLSYWGVTTSPSVTLAGKRQEEGHLLGGWVRATAENAQLSALLVPSPCGPPTPSTPQSPQPRPSTLAPLGGWDQLQ